MEKTFIRTHAALDLTISISLIICGMSLVSLPTSQSVNVLGFFLLAAGLIIAAVWKSGYRDAETGEKFSKKEHYFALSERTQIMEAVENHKLENIDYKNEDRGNGLRLDVYVNSNKSRAYIQVFEYVPYKYEPCTAQYEYIGKDL